MSMKLALQMFSLRDCVNGDLPALLQKVKNAGYDGVEFAGFNGMKAPELKRTLDRIGLRSAGSHTDLNLLKNDLDGVIEYNRIIGSRYIVIPCAGLDKEEDCLSLAEFCNEAGKKIDEAGMRLLFHNHYTEFAPDFNGKSRMDLLFENTLPKALGFELDLCWVYYAGFDPAATMRRFGRRCETVHLKDITNRESRIMTECGTGSVDLKGSIAQGKEFGFDWFIVEQDEIRIDPIESITISCKNIRKIG